jgi:hypothetical protein
MSSHVISHARVVSPSGPASEKRRWEGQEHAVRATGMSPSSPTMMQKSYYSFISLQSVVPAIPSPYCLRPRNSAKEEPKASARAAHTFSVWASKRRERHYNLARSVDEPQVCTCKPPLTHDVQQCGRWVTLQRPLQVAKGSKSTGWAGPVGLVRGATVRSRWSAVRSFSGSWAVSRCWQCNSIGRA